MKTITKAYRFKLDPSPTQEAQLHAMIRAANTVWNLLVEQQRWLWSVLRQWPKADREDVLRRILTEWRGGEAAVAELLADRRRRIEEKVAAGQLDHETAKKKLDKVAFNPYQEMWNTIALQVTELRGEFESIEAAPSGSLRAVVQNMERQATQLWKGMRGQPRYHSIRSGGGFKFFTKAEVVERSDGKAWKVKLAKVGSVPIHFTDRSYPPKGIIKICSGAVTYDGLQWRCSLTVEEPAPTPILHEGRTVYVHLGLKNLAYLLIEDADGKREYRTLAPPDRLQIGDRLITYDQARKVLRRMQRSLSRREKGSKRRDRKREEIKLFHSRLAAAREDYLHRMSAQILALAPMRLVLQDWEIRTMMKDRRYARLVADAGWAILHHQLKYKADWKGTEVVMLPADLKVSATCSQCGAVDDDFPIGKPVYVCSKCSMQKDREHNALDNQRNAVVLLQS